MHSSFAHMFTRIAIVSGIIMPLILVVLIMMSKRRERTRLAARR